MNSSEKFPPREMGFDSEELRRELERLRKENSELRRRLGISVNQPTHSHDTKSEQQSLNDGPIFSLTADSSSAEKILLFRNLFRGKRRCLRRFMDE